MDATNNIATDLFYKIRSRFTGLKLGDAAGAITINPETARFFDFDYKDGDKKIGHVSISLAENNSIKVYFSTGITESMDDLQKTNWYNFLRELRQFAKRRLLSFDTRDIAKDNLDQRDYAFLSQYNKPQQHPNQITEPVGESIMSESTMYGSKNLSFQKLMDTRLIIKHSKAVMDDTMPGARARNIAALFVENQSGERFKYPFIHLAGARAMQRHVANGGLPYDEVGKSIVGMSEEIAQLKSFGNYVVRNDLMNNSNNGIIEKSAAYLEHLRETVKNLSKQHHYENYVANFKPQESAEIPEDIIEQYTEQFTVKSFNENVKSVFPVLYRLMKENEIGYTDVVEMTSIEDQPADEEFQSIDPFKQFETWALNLGEESAIISQDPQERNLAVKNLQDLVGQAFPAGVDGNNAIQSLKGIIEDPSLFNEIKQLSKEDPETDLRGVIKNWLEQKSFDDDSLEEVLNQLDFGDYTEEESRQEDLNDTQQGNIQEASVIYDFDDVENYLRKYGFEFDEETDTEQVYYHPEYGTVYVSLPKFGEKTDDGEKANFVWRAHPSEERTDGHSMEMSGYAHHPREIVADLKGFHDLEKRRRANRPREESIEVENEEDMRDDFYTFAELFSHPDDSRHPKGEGIWWAAQDSADTRNKNIITFVKNVIEYSEIDPDSLSDSALETAVRELKKYLEKEERYSTQEQATQPSGEKSPLSQVNVQELAEFLHTFYDQESGTFPKGPEGVCTIVSKKFGPRAEHVARAFVNRMAPEQSIELGSDYQDLERLQRLAGLN